MTRPKDTVNAGVRLSVEGDWELRCNDCSRRGQTRYWPLTPEFWQPKWGMTRCRACWMDRRAARNRERWRTDPKWRAAKLAENREQRRAMARFAYRERWARLKADPVKYAEYVERRRAKQREASQRYRDRRAERAA